MFVSRVLDFIIHDIILSRDVIKIVVLALMMNLVTLTIYHKWSQGGRSKSSPGVRGGGSEEPMHPPSFLDKIIKAVRESFWMRNFPFMVPLLAGGYLLLGTELGNVNLNFFQKDQRQFHEREKAEMRKQEIDQYLSDQGYSGATESTGSIDSFEPILSKQSVRTSSPQNTQVAKKEMVVKRTDNQAPTMGFDEGPRPVRISELVQSQETPGTQNEKKMQEDTVFQPIIAPNSPQIKKAPQRKMENVDIPQREIPKQMSSYVTDESYVESVSSVQVKSRSPQQGSNAKEVDNPFVQEAPVEENQLEPVLNQGFVSSQNQPVQSIQTKKNKLKEFSDFLKEGEKDNATNERRYIYVQGEDGMEIPVIDISQKPEIKPPSFEEKLHTLFENLTLPEFCKVVRQEMRNIGAAEENVTNKGKMKVLSRLWVKYCEIMRADDLF